MRWVVLFVVVMMLVVGCDVGGYQDSDGVDHPATCGSNAPLAGFLAIGFIFLYRYLIKKYTVVTLSQKRVKSR